MAVAIEDAGFEIRDQIMWVYGSGFPKSHNISKGIDKAAGELEHENVGFTVAGSSHNDKLLTSGFAKDYVPPKPVTLEAQQWQGWGTALKPAHEPIVLARKPFIGTVANNVLTYGVGGINIDGSRVGSDVMVNPPGSTNPCNSMGDGWRKDAESTTAIGRFPANFIHDGSDEVNELLGEPARFFYCAKASKRDRNEGLDGFEAKRDHDGRADGGVGGDNPRNRTNNAKLNHHPTVKPTDLMRYLCRLITPPKGVILDPFMGSGSTGKAAIIEGFEFIGVDQSSEYCEIARARIEYAQKTLPEFEQDSLL
jgi:site-specific DNA-methyltransferase (adenine-specific)